MIGFELEINGKKTSAAIAEGVLSVIITKVTNEYQDSLEIDFTGMDTKESKYVDWNRGKLKEGDELVLKIKNIEEISAPFNVRKINKEDEKEQKLKKYHALKKALEEEGLM